MKLLDIATQLAVWGTEGHTTAKCRTKHEIHHSLHHTHLPALLEAGLVSENGPDDMITVGPAEDDFDRLVEQQLPADFGDLLRSEAETFDAERGTEAFPDGTVGNRLDKAE